MKPFKLSDIVYLLITGCVLGEGYLRRATAIGVMLVILAVLAYIAWGWRLRNRMKRVAILLLLCLLPSSVKGAELPPTPETPHTDLGLAGAVIVGGCLIAGGAYVYIRLKRTANNLLNPSPPKTNSPPRSIYPPGPPPITNHTAKVFTLTNTASTSFAHTPGPDGNDYAQYMRTTLQVSYDLQTWEDIDFERWDSDTLTTVACNGRVMTVARGEIPLIELDSAPRPRAFYRWKP